MSPRPSQLPLALVHPPQYGRESFLRAACNAAAWSLIERWPDWTAPVAVLSGPAGSGKTHLAHIWSERAGATMIAAAELVRGGAEPVPTGSATVVEDVDPENVPESALFHLINRAKEHRASLVATSRKPASEWRVGLADLRSRLRLAHPAALEAPDDDLLRKVLVKLFADRQIVVERTVLDYLLVRMERSLAAAASLVDALDREALARGARITRPMAAGILSALGDG